MNSDEEFVKSNGCMCPMHPLQITSYIAFALYVFSFYFIDIVVWSDSPIIAWSFGVPYTILLILIVIFTLMATLVNPTDPTVFMERFNKYLVP